MSFVSYTIIYRIFWFFHKAGVAGLACKQVIYNVLPEEVLRYGEEHSFPIFLIEEGSWFENIIFEIMTAVEQDDARYLSEDLLRNMVHGTAAAGDIDTARRGISLLLRRSVSALYLKSPELDIARIYRAYYMSKHLKKKALVIRYDGGLFLLITSDRSTEEAHRVVLQEALEQLRIPSEASHTLLSQVHPAGNLDVAIRQAWYGRMAGFVRGEGLSRYEELGAYAALMPLAGTTELREYAARCREQLDGYQETISAYVKGGGDILTAAAALHCHANTVRYRLARMKELLGSPDRTDHELFRDLAVAYMVWMMEE